MRGRLRLDYAVGFARNDRSLCVEYAPSDAKRAIPGAPKAWHRRLAADDVATLAEHATWLRQAIYGGRDANVLVTQVSPQLRWARSFHQDSESVMAPLSRLQAGQVLSPWAPQPSAGQRQGGPR
jgi:hypothetical protein